MFRKLPLLASAILAITLAGVPAAYGGTKPDKQAQLVEKVRTGISQLGTGEQARVELKLTDKTKLKGYVSEASGDHFTVVDKNTGAATRVTYGQVQQVKGNNLSTGAKIAIGLGILAGILTFLLILENTG
jgi:hypothetical protein